MSRGANEPHCRRMSKVFGLAPLEVEAALGEKELGVVWIDFYQHVVGYHVCLPIGRPGLWWSVKTALKAPRMKATNLPCSAKMSFSQCDWRTFSFKVCDKRRAMCDVRFFLWWPRL